MESATCIKTKSEKPKVQSSELSVSLEITDIVMLLSYSFKFFQFLKLSTRII